MTFQYEGCNGVLAEGIEDGFETANNELGLDHQEKRSWHGRHRHGSLVMMAFATLAAVRHHANTATATIRHCFTATMAMR